MIMLVALAASFVLAACGAPPTGGGDEPPAASTPPPATDTPPAATDSPPPTAGPDGLLIFRRSGGFQGIDEQYTIHEDGRVFDKAGNPLENQAELAPLLFRDVADLGFYEMKPSYLPKDTCCDRFTYEITVRDNGREHTVITIDDAPDEPANLKLLRSKIHFVLYRE